MGQEIDKKKLFHQIRNCLNPVFTFVQMIDTSLMEPRVQTFQKNCIKHCEEALDLLKKLEEKK